MTVLPASPTETYHQLTFGPLVLADGTDARPDPDVDYWFRVAGLDRGVSAPIERTILTLLQDGAVTVTDGHENRTANVIVWVYGTTSLALAEGEAALKEQTERANTLVWTPFDSWGPASVFEVFTSSLGLIEDEQAELFRMRRGYTLRLVCHPTVRSVDEVVTEAISNPTVTQVRTTIDAGNTLTRWSAPYGKLVDQGSRLAVEATRSPRPTYRAPAGSPVNLTGTPYVSLTLNRAKEPHPGIYTLLPLQTTPALYADGVACTLIAVEATGLPSTYRYWWQVVATTVNEFKFATDFTAYDELQFSSLQRANVPPGQATARQKVRTVEVLGSARTQASLALEHETSALGSVLVYTWPVVDADYRQALRPYRVSGGVQLSDTTLVSGVSDNLDTMLVFDVPVANLVRGAHLLVARLRSDTLGGQDLNWGIQARIGGVNVGPARTGTRTLNFSTTGDWRMVAITREQLPTTDFPDNTSAVIRIALAAASVSASNIDLDEGWIFNSDIGCLSWVECGTTSPAPGGASNRLWLDNPTTEVTRPRLYRGTAADRSDAQHAGLSVASGGIHNFDPPLMNLLTVTSGAVDAMCSLSHFPRWDTHAAK